ncbi:MAG TPA: glycosyltransferase family 2 protein [Thermomicrobiales bacterium]|nr:glycosyltransferase family 2 protein [Thermomicrobiales bacterium]
MTVPGWTAVVVNYNGAGYLDACLRALERTRPAPVDILVVDNASADDSLQELHAFPRVRVLAQPRNLGFAGGANAGLAAIETELALLMNPDVEVDPDFGSALLSAFVGDDRLGAAGALLRYPDSDRIQHAGGIIERPLMTTSHVAYGRQISETRLTPADVDFVTGGAMGLRMDAFRSVNGFDEAFSPVYYEDVDLCVKLRDAGWRVRFYPTLRATHHEGVTLERSDTYHQHLHRNRIRFALKHLTGHEWRTSFVPAEHNRLRHELHTLVEDGWPVRSGAAGIESLLRGFEAEEGWNVAPMLHSPPPAILERRIDAARDLAQPPEDQPGRLPSIALRVIGMFRDVGLRRQVAIALEQQRQFNEAVVHALEAQDVMNREQTAITLLLALDILGRLQANPSETTAPPMER